MKCFNHIEYIMLCRLRPTDEHARKQKFIFFYNGEQSRFILHPIKMIYLTVFDTFDCLTRVIGPFHMAMCSVEIFSICLNYVKIGMTATQYFDWDYSC